MQIPVLPFAIPRADQIAHAFCSVFLEWERWLLPVSVPCFARFSHFPPQDLFAFFVFHVEYLAIFEVDGAIAVSSAFLVFTLVGEIGPHLSADSMELVIEECPRVAIVPQLTSTFISLLRISLVYKRSISAHGLLRVVQLPDIMPKHSFIRTFVTLFSTHMKSSI